MRTHATVVNKREISRLIQLVGLDGIIYAFPAYVSGPVGRSCLIVGSEELWIHWLRNNFVEVPKDPSPAIVTNLKLVKVEVNE